MLLIIFANFTGCGVKGNPVVSSVMPDNGMVVQNFKADYSENAVKLSWDFYGRNPKMDYIAVEKSMFGSPGNECRNCPRTFERIGQIPVKEIKKKNNEYDTLHFTDEKVRQGKTYNYRLLLCDEFDRCLENSATEINVQ